MLKQVDKYIIKKFLGTFVLALGLIIFIVVVFDISEKIGFFIEKKIPVKEIVYNYYLNFIPFFINMFSALFVFIAVIYFTSRMAFNTEIVAMLSSGISFYRLMVPYIISALIIGLVNLYLVNFLIPNVNKERLAFEAQYFLDSKPVSEYNIHFKQNDSTYYYMETFYPRTNTGYRFTVETINKNGLQEKIRANSIRYDSTEAEWILQDYSRRKLNDYEEELETGNLIKLKLPVSPIDFTKQSRNVEEMDYVQLNWFIAQEKMRGSRYVKFYDYEKYQRYTYPFTAVILTLIGLALSSQKRRGGIGIHLAFGIALAFGYIVFMQVSKVFATAGNFPAWLAAFIPVILYSFIAVYLMKKAPK